MLTKAEAKLYWGRIVARTKAIKGVDDLETAAEKSARMKRLEKDYTAWFEYYFPNYAKCRCARFHKKLADAIVKRRVTRVLAEIYRSGAKSVHIDMGIPLYLMYVKNDLRFMLLVGETDIKASKLLAATQAQIQYNPRLCRDYGERFEAGDWAEGDFRTSDGVRFMSLGFGQNPRGAREDENRPDYIAVDDVDNKRHVNNDRMMSESVDFITEDIWGCFDSTTNSTERFVFANNNFHKNSITNRLKLYFEEAKKNCRQAGDKDIFEIISVCAVKSLATFEPEWKEKTSAEYWRKKYNSTPYRSFMREFMHTHVETGALFKAEDIIYGKTAALDKYDALVFYGDLSYKEQGDFKGLVLVGRIGRQFHIIYTYLRRGSRAKCAEWLYDLYEDKKLINYNIKYLIEGLFAMDDFVSDFDLEGDKRGYYIPVTADKRGKTDKFDRIESLVGHFERHNVIFNEAEKASPDQVRLRDQFLAFEKGSRANDDGPDAVHGAFKTLFTITRLDKFEVECTGREQVRSNSKNRY